MPEKINSEKDNEYKNKEPSDNFVIMAAIFIFLGLIFFGLSATHKFVKTIENKGIQQYKETETKQQKETTQMPTKVIYQCERCGKKYDSKKECNKCCPDFLDFDISNLKINDMTLNYSEYPPTILINGSVSLRIKKLKTEVEIPVYCYEELWFSIGIDDNLCDEECLRTIPDLNRLSDQELEDIKEFIRENSIDESKIIEAMKNIKIKFIINDSSINLVYDKNKKETE